MMAGKTLHAAVDIGKSGVKMMLASFDGSRITQEELIRYPVNNVRCNGHYYINIYEIYRTILQGLARFTHEHGQIATTGIDTWGTDYGLIGASGELTGNVYYFRDPRTNSILDEIHKKMSDRELFDLTAMDTSPQYVFAQLCAQTLQDPGVLAQAQTLLLFPDLLSYFLTGNKMADLTIAGQSQMLDRRTNTWNEKLFETFGLNRELMPPLVAPGTFAGTLRQDIAEEYGLGTIRHVCVAGHDTATALTTLYDMTEDDVFISAGSTITMGNVNDRLMMSQEAFENGYKNLPGVFGSNLFYRDLNGFWVVNECIDFWNKHGEGVNFQTLEEHVYDAPVSSVIDLGDEGIVNADADMPAAVRAYCRRTGQQIPETNAQVFGCLLRSIAAGIGRNMEAFEKIHGAGCRSLFLISGGSQSGYFRKKVEEETGKKTFGGLANATAFGNIALQVAAQEGITERAQVDEIMRRSYQYESFA